MSNLEWRGKFHEVKGDLKKKWGVLTDDDLTYEEGREEETIGRIQRRTGEARDNVVNFIDELIGNKPRV